MADVFLSYRNLPDRRAIVDRLAAILEANGFDVWWDYGLEAGAPYRQQILDELAAAKAVVPLWCEESVASEWVQMEAGLGKAKLLPARLQNVAPPSEFEPIQSADLVGWTGAPDDDRIRRLVAGLASLTGVQVKERVSLVRQLALLPSVGVLQSRAVTVDQAFDEANKTNTRRALLDFARQHPDHPRAAEAIEIADQLPPGIAEIIRNQTLSGHKGPVTFAAFSPTSEHIVTLGDDETIRVWSGVDGRQVSKMSGHKEGAGCVAWSPDGRLLATVGLTDETLRIWEAKSGRQIAICKNVDGGCVVFSRDGTRIFVCYGDQITVHDARSAKHIGRKPMAGRSFRPVWSHDQTRIAAPQESGEILVCEAASGAGLGSFRGHHSHTSSVSWHVGGGFLCSGGADRAVRIWDLNTGQNCGELSGHTHTVSSVDWSIDGSWIASSGGDNTARIWDPATGQQIALITGHSGWVHTVQFDPDATRVVTASADGTAALWEIVIEPD